MSFRSISFRCVAAAGFIAVAIAGMAPAKAISAAISRVAVARSRRKRVEPRMMKSGPVESSVTICQIGTPAAKP